VGDVESGSKPYTFELTQSEIDKITCTYDYGKKTAAMRGAIGKRTFKTEDIISVSEDGSSSSDSDCDEDHHKERYGQFTECAAECKIHHIHVSDVESGAKPH
jgi:hypothetical protein